MDDFAVSENEETKLTTIYGELTTILNNIHLPMSKWATNSTTLQLQWQAEGLSTQTETQVRGVDWYTESDDFSLSFRQLWKCYQSVPLESVTSYR